MRKGLLIFFLPLLFASCIKNDIPYPQTAPVFKSLKVENGKAEIKEASFQINVSLEETADIKSVLLYDYVVTVDKDTIQFKDGFYMTPSLPGRFDLSQPLTVVLHTYYDYPWKIVATQNIERYFTVRGQVGETTIDVANRRVVVSVTKKTSLSQIEVTSMKLGPVGAEYSKTPEELTDFTEGAQVVDVTAYGRAERWTIFVEQTESVVELKKVIPWSRIVWLQASGIDGQDNGFAWRAEGAKEWNIVPKEDIVFSGGQFSTGIDNLEPERNYECYAYCGGDQTQPQSFTTEAVEQLPNPSFEVYSHAESENFYSFYDPATTYSTKWWDSGNAGAAMVSASSSICNPDTEVHAEGATSARLNSRYVVVKFAAGNLFCGEFAGTIGVSGGKVNFGRPFTLRPRKMTLYVKYDCGKIDCIDEYPASDPVKMGDNDCCQIFVALGDWDYRKYGGTKDSPVQVNTTKKETLFDPKGENVIAYGAFTSRETISSLTKVEIPLEYADISRKPTHIIISCAASKLGDYFTGSSTSTLWVDHMVLEY